MTMSGPRPRQRRQEQRETPSRGLQSQPSPSDPVAGNSGPARRRRARSRTSSLCARPPPRDVLGAGPVMAGAEAAGKGGEGGVRRRTDRRRRRETISVRASVWGLQNPPSRRSSAAGGRPVPPRLARPLEAAWPVGASGSRPATREVEEPRRRGVGAPLERRDGAGANGVDYLS